MRPIELFKTVHLPFYDFSALDALDHYGTALEIPHKGSRRAPQSAGIAPLYAIEGFVHVALDHSELAAIDGDLVIGATLLHALIMDADRHRAFVRAPLYISNPNRPATITAGIATIQIAIFFMRTLMAIDWRWRS